HPPPGVFQAVEFVRVESGPAQAVLPLVGLAARKIIRPRVYLDPDNLQSKPFLNGLIHPNGVQYYPECSAAVEFAGGNPRKVRARW
ncbi:MAG: hypothetical protein R6U98_16575, partial [Pirellulaceae bacterium]